MSRKTIILREDQFNEICGTNTAYFDNSNDYAEDGTTTVKAAGAVSDDNGEKEYSDPVTGKEWGHELAPETLFALLFRNGGHGLWGHWGSGLRTDKLTEDKHDANDEEYEIGLNEEYDGPDVDEEIYYAALKCLRKTEFGQEENLVDYIYKAMEMLSGEKPCEMIRPKEIERYQNNDVRGAAEQVVRLAMKLIDHEYYWEQYAGSTIKGLDEGKKKLKESNSELEGRRWNGNTYTNLTTKKSQYKKQLDQLVKSGAPKQQIKRVKAAYMGVCSILDRETNAIKGRKTAMKNLGMPNQFQKAGGNKESGNGKAHTRKKVNDPNVGTGYITYK